MTADAVAEQTDQDVFVLGHSGTQTAAGAAAAGSAGAWSGKKSLEFACEVALVPQVKPAEFTGRCRGVSVIDMEAMNPYVRAAVESSHERVQPVSVNLRIICSGFLATGRSAWAASPCQQRKLDTLPCPWHGPSWHSRPLVAS